MGSLLQLWEASYDSCYFRAKCKKTFSRRARVDRLLWKEVWISAGVLHVILERKVEISSATMRITVLSMLLAKMLEKVCLMNHPLWNHINRVIDSYKYNKMPLLRFILWWQVLLPMARTFPTDWADFLVFLMCILRIWITFP